MTLYSGRLIPRRSKILVLDENNLSDFIEDENFKYAVSFEVNVAQKLAGNPTVGTGTLSCAATAQGAGKVDNFEETYDLATTTGGGWTTYYGSADRFNFNLNAPAPSGLQVEVTVVYWVGA